MHTVPRHPAPRKRREAMRPPPGSSSAATPGRSRSAPRRRPHSPAADTPQGRGLLRVPGSPSGPRSPSRRIEGCGPGLAHAPAALPRPVRAARPPGPSVRRVSAELSLRLPAPWIAGGRGPGRKPPYSLCWPCVGPRDLFCSQLQEALSFRPLLRGIKWKSPKRPLSFSHAYSNGLINL